MSDIISIKGLDKAAVFAALYNVARPQGAGFLQYDPTPITAEMARKMMELGDDTKRDFGHNGGNLYFDYVKGRVMKVDLSRDELDPRLYDRDNGHGSAARAIESLRKQTVSTN